MQEDEAVPQSESSNPIARTDSNDDLQKTQLLPPNKPVMSIDTIIEDNNEYVQSQSSMYRSNYVRNYSSVNKKGFEHQSVQNGKRESNISTKSLNFEMKVNEFKE